MALLPSPIRRDHMLNIECPWCGLRHETEFSYGGEAHIARPENPEELSDKEWADFFSNQ